MRKRILALILLLVCSASFLVGCNAGTTIDCFIYDESDTFMGELAQLLSSRVDKSTQLEFHYASNSQNIQNKQIIERLNNKSKIMLVNIVDRASSGAVLAKCAKSNISVIFFNREPLTNDLALSDNAFYVGADPENTGELQADMVHDLLSQDGMFEKYDKNGDGKLQTVILKGQQGHQDAEKRTASSIKRLEQLNYNLDILSTEVANWKRDEAYTAYEKIYEKYDDSVELILANNDDMALGAIDYLKEKNVIKASSLEYQQPVLIVGVDGTAKGFKAVSDGFLYGTVLNDSMLQSQIIIELMDYILNGKNFATFPYEMKNDRYIYIKGKIILKNDI